MSHAFLPIRSVATALGLLILLMPAAKSDAQGANARPDTSCAQICGSWQHAAPDDAPAERLLDVALAKYREPDAVLNSGNYARCEEEPCATPGPDPADDFLDPKASRRNWRPTRAEMREELLPKAHFATALALTWEGGRLAILWDADLRHYRPGESYVRVDAWGAAEIECHWRNGRFIIREDYGRGRRNTDVYRYDAQKQVLYVERRLDRPGLSTVVLSRAYAKRS